MDIIEKIVKNSEKRKRLMSAIERLSIDENCLSTGEHIVKHLQSLNCDETTKIAALFYPAFLSSDYPETAFQKYLPKEVMTLIVNTKRIEHIDQLEQKETSFSKNTNQSERLRKLLLAMVDDIRIVLIKLCEQLVQLELAKNKPCEIQKTLAKQTFRIYAPLANRLGIGQIKWQLEDWACRYLYHDDYLSIAKGLKMRRVEREQYIGEMIQTLENLLEKNHIHNVEITGRPKHIYSICRKINRKQVSLKEIYDASALRILLDNVESCYAALSVIHHVWEPIAVEFDDYIANPKQNGYQSIHTAIIGPNERNVEIQMRTRTMHEEAELGVAAHWMYKEGQVTLSSYERKINYLRQVLDWQNELSKNQGDAAPSETEIFDDRVYVFTPNGDILDLEEGATPLDFAYHVHTEVGHRCRGAKINGTLMPLTYHLKNGDQVIIITTKEGVPSRDWLNKHAGYIKTTRARSKIAQHFRQEDHDKHLADGIAIAEKALKKTPYSRKAFIDVLDHYAFKTVDQLLSAIGAGDVNIDTVIGYLDAINQSKTDLPLPLPPRRVKKHKPGFSAPVSIEGDNSLLTQIALCCRPVPGEPIIGYISHGRGVSVHRADCKNLLNLKQHTPEKIIPVQWENENNAAYPIHLRIAAQDYPGLLRDLMQVTTTAEIPLLDCHTQLNRAKLQAIIDLTLSIKDLAELDKLKQKFKQLPDIIHIERI